MEVIKRKFSSYSENTDYLVSLTSTKLSYEPDISESSTKPQSSEENVINISDVIGCACMKSKLPECEEFCYLKIFAYPLCKKRNERRRKIITLEINTEGNFESNLRVAQDWKKMIESVMYKKEDSVISVCPTHEQLFSIKKRLLILINPASGKGLAVQIWKTYMEPILEEADVPHDLLLTEYSSHGRDFVKDNDLSQYSGIVVVSGDGLIHEVFNGLYQRGDPTSLSIPVGVIPGGSGNGFAMSVAHLNKEPYTYDPVLSSCLNITNPVAEKMDLLLVSRPGGNQTISFLSFGYGIVADIDLESEYLRPLGDLRFDIWAFFRIVALRKYKARISYKRLQSSASTNEEETRTTTSSSHFDNSQAQNLTDVEHLDTNLAIRSEPNSNILPSQSSFGGKGRSKPEHNKGRGKSNQKINVRASEEEIMNNNVVINEDVFSKPLPDEWETIEDYFIEVFGANQPYISRTAFISPKSTWNDGVIWLCLVNGRASKTNVIKFLIGLENGTHVNVPHVSFFPVTEVVIEPLTDKGKFNIDGELVEHGPLHAKVLRGAASIMCRKS